MNNQRQKPSQEAVASGSRGDLHPTLQASSVSNRGSFKKGNRSKQFATNEFLGFEMDQTSPSAAASVPTVAAGVGAVPLTMNENMQLC